MYQRLLAYKKEHKDTNVPHNYKEDPQLGHWATTQRFFHRDKKMTEERKHLLNSIGFVWELLRKNIAPWEEMYQRLVVFKKEHKHTQVPQKYKEIPQLGRWVNTQRVAYRDKNMTEERKHLLDSIGFVWELSRTNKAQWEEMYQRLVVFKKEHKHTQVPTKYKEDPQLGEWVSTQRAVHRNKKMTEERRHLLDSVGFVWELSKKNKAPWEEMYQCLVAYKTEHMHTNVSTKYKKDPQLGRWVSKQRIAYRNEKMTERRKRLLNSIDFVWELPT